jgi:hypothetical protein
LINFNPLAFISQPITFQSPNHIPPRLIPNFPTGTILLSPHFPALIALIPLRFDWPIICYEAN